MPSALVDELARGIYPPAEVASWFGFSETEWERLREWKPLQKAVDAKRAEYERDGLSTQLKARMMYAEVLDRAFLHAMKDDASFRSIMDFLGHTAEIADMKPKRDMSAQQGAGFTINISFPNKSPTVPTTITVEPTTAGDPLANMPTYISSAPVEFLDVSYVDVPG